MSARRSWPKASRSECRVRTAYKCEFCAEIIFRPDWTDASVEMYDAEMGFRWERTHIPCCPTCGRPVRAVPPLTATLLDIARGK